MSATADAQSTFSSLLFFQLLPGNASLEAFDLTHRISLSTGSTDDNGSLWHPSLRSHRSWPVTRISAGPLSLTRLPTFCSACTCLSVCSSRTISFSRASFSSLAALTCWVSAGPPSKWARD